MDVDIDFQSDFDPLDIFPDAVRASRIQDNKLLKHNAGIYFQHIPKDQITKFSAIPYKEAEALGYFKIDFLHLTFLDTFGSKHEIRTLIKKEPDWQMLQSPSTVARLFQLHNNFELLSRVKPENVLELADCIALIRPSKKILIENYIKEKRKGDLTNFRKILYAKPTDGRAYYKKPHAVSYALTIVLQLHLIKANII